MENVIYGRMVCVCVWMELFEVDLSRFRLLQGGIKTHSFSKMRSKVR